MTKDASEKGTSKVNDGRIDFGFHKQARNRIKSPLDHSIAHSENKRNAILFPNYDPSDTIQGKPAIEADRLY